MTTLNKYEALMIFGILVTDVIMTYFIYLELKAGVGRNG